MNTSDDYLWLNIAQEEEIQRGEAMNTSNRYIKELEQRRKEILAQGQTLRIVNAGRMNHGKSSLFNSLLDKKECFKTGDIRVTRTKQQELFEKDVYLIDTPGLDADDNDDAEAFSAYRTAHMIIFVHTLQTGELHADELNAIRRMQQEYPQNMDFWKHFCLVLTFSEAVEKEAIEAMKRKILSDIQKVCGKSSFPVFLVSNLRYGKGKDMGKQGFIKASGVEEMRKFLTDHIREWKREAAAINLARFEEAKKQVLRKLQQDRAALQTKIQQQNRKQDTTMNRLSRVLSSACNELCNLKEECYDSRKLLQKYDREYEKYKRKLKRLRDKHDNEYYESYYEGAE